MRKQYRTELLSKGYITIPTIGNNTSNNYEDIAAFLSTLRSYGFTLDLKSINKLKLCSSDNIKRAYFNMVSTLNEALGNDVNHIVFYKDFPSLENLTEEDYFYNAIFHYLTASKDSYGYMDESDTNRMPLENYDDVTVLHLVDEEEGMSIIKTMVSKMIESKTAIPESKKPFITSVLKDTMGNIDIKEIPFKENMVFYIKNIVDLSLNKKAKVGDILSSISLEYIKTVTDLLRLYVILSNEDYTLKNKCKFVSLDRKARRVLINILNNIAASNNTIFDELSAHEFLWKRALEKLHIGEYQDKYPHAYSISKKFRENDYVTFNGELHRMFDEGNIFGLLEKLSTKPGVFARGLDALLRHNKVDQELVLREFNRISVSISSPLLIQLYEFFDNRNLYNTRIFKINKGLTNFYKEVEDLRPVIDESIINRVLSIIKESLMEIYSSKDKLEKVYLSENMKNYCIPVNNRSASSGYHTLPYASRVKLDTEDQSIIRLFTHWKNSGKNRIDIDLSAEFFDDDFNYVTSLAWHNMTGGKKFSSYHSGDIVSAPNGASEFIDINYVEAKEYARYVVICNYVYSGEAYKDIPECFSGIMFRKNKGKKGEIFEASTVKYKYDLTQDSSSENIAYVIDLKTMELIWIDCAHHHSPSFALVAAGDLSLIAIIKQALKKHMSIYDLVMLHKDQIEFVDNKEDASVIIDDSSDSSLSPYDLEKLSADWL